MKQAVTMPQADRPGPVSRLALVAICAALAGSAGCALPHTLPVTTETTSGPSPYGIWYEQHWATNSVLLAAADQPDGEVEILDDSEFDVYNAEAASEEDAAIQSALDDYASAEEAAAASAEADAARAEAAYEASAARAQEFDNSTPYQFPASDYAPAATGAEGDSSDLGRGAIRY